MGFHHVAMACRDTEANHRFYTESMGFELVKVVVGKTPGGGWAKHFFYETGGNGLIAFWEIHDDAEVREDWSSDLSRGCGLPPWVNHIAYEAKSEAEYGAALARWLETGHDTVEVEHGFCKSIYTEDPNGTTVEWCLTLAPFTAEDRARAEAALTDPNPEHEPDQSVRFHRANA